MSETEIKRPTHSREEETVKTGELRTDEGVTEERELEEGMTATQRERAGRKGERVEMVIIAEAESDKEVAVDLLLSHGLPSA